MDFEITGSFSRCLASNERNRKKGTSGSSSWVVMRILLLGFCLLCLSISIVQSKPQITKLFPVPEEMNDPQQPSNNEAKPLDKLLGKLRATYNFVFRKPENTSNVEKILAKDTPDPDVEALRLIWSNRMQQNSRNKEDAKVSPPKGAYAGSNNNWANIQHIQPLNRLEPLETLEPLELEDEVENDRDQEVEFVTPTTNFQFPVTISRQLIQWLGSLLGITFGVYSKLARAIYANSTAIQVN